MSAGPSNRARFILAPLGVAAEETGEYTFASPLVSLGCRHAHGRHSKPDHFSGGTWIVKFNIGQVRRLRRSNILHLSARRSATPRQVWLNSALVDCQVRRPSSARKTVPGGPLIAILARRPRRPTRRTAISIPSTSTTRVWPSAYHSMQRQSRSVLWGCPVFSVFLSLLILSPIVADIRTRKSNSAADRDSFRTYRARKIPPGGTKNLAGNQSLRVNSLTSVSADELTP